MFNKIGTPQPLKVASEMCVVCLINKAECMVNGKFVCSACKASMEQFQAQSQQQPPQTNGL
jgi:hypothetical protein